MTTKESHPERVGKILGVPARFFPAHYWPNNDLFSTQTATTEARPCPAYGEHAMIHANLRFDDSCRNWHNSFSITGRVHDTRYRGERGYLAGGCLHGDIAAAFPELALLIPWHLCATDGPMHYVANTVYHAGDRDHYGDPDGKERDLDAARRSAVWPDATDEELCAEPRALTAALKARLPHLLLNFRFDMIAAGFKMGAAP